MNFNIINTFYLDFFFVVFVFALDLAEDFALFREVLLTGDFDLDLLLFRVLDFDLVFERDLRLIFFFFCFKSVLKFPAFLFFSST